MSQALSVSADRLGCSERTLRRYVNEGLLRGRRVARRQLELPGVEEEYLAGHWELLSHLRRALRTEPGVRLAVLFGSAAVAEDDVLSDVDLLVCHRDPSPRTLAGLRLRLRRVLERPVDVVALGEAETMPTLLSDILREGRVLVDRDGLWQCLRERRQEIFASAAIEERALAGRARETVAAARDRIAVAA